MLDHAAATRPLFRALAAALTGPADRPRPPGTARTGAALRILVADDHPVNQRLVLLQLAQLGHHADLVSNGAEAVTAVAAPAFDVVLMDVRMPELDGPAATRLIRAELGDRSPWIIAVTADALPGTRDACLAAGMDDFLTKPLVAADLARALARARGRRRVRARPGRARPPCASWSAGTRRRCPDLVAEFLAETPPLVQALRAAVAVGDPGRAHHAAHTLKGLGATFGATTMARLCQRAESHSAEPSPDMTPLVAEIAAEHERVMLALAGWRSPRGSGRPLSCTSWHEGGLPATSAEPPPTRFGVWSSLGRRLAAPCSLVSRGQRRPRHRRGPAA